MRRYLIMLSALFVAIIVMTMIKSWQRRRAIARGEDPEAIKGITIAHLTGAFAGLVVFFLSVYLLEGTSSAPGTASIRRIQLTSLPRPPLPIRTIRSQYSGYW